MIRIDAQLHPVVIRVELAARVTHVDDADEAADRVFRDEARLEVAVVFPPLVPVADLLDGPLVLREGAVGDRDRIRVIGLREWPDADDGPLGGAQPASSAVSSSRDSWRSRAMRSFTVPKSWRWNGVTPSWWSALRWSIVG